MRLAPFVVVAAVRLLAAHYGEARSSGMCSRAHWFPLTRVAAISTSTARAGWSLTTNGDVTTIVADGHGRWVLAGNFSCLGNVVVRGLTRIRADGSVDQWWGPPHTFTPLA